MSVVYLFYSEDEGTGGLLSTAFSVPHLDQYTYMFGGELASIHPADADYTAKTPMTYPTLEAAWLAYPTHSWVYLDPNATVYLDQFPHPADNVVYVVGHDLTGFGRSNLSNGTRVKLRTIRPEPFVGIAIPILLTVMIDRMSAERRWP